MGSIARQMQQKKNEVKDNQCVSGVSTDQVGSAKYALNNTNFCNGMILIFVPLFCKSNHSNSIALF